MGISEYFPRQYVNASKSAFQCSEICQQAIKGLHVIHLIRGLSHLLFLIKIQYQDSIFYLRLLNYYNFQLFFACTKTLFLKTIEVPEMYKCFLAWKLDRILLLLIQRMDSLSFLFKKNCQDPPRIRSQMNMLTSDFLVLFPSAL